MQRLQRGDTVVVMSGKYKGKQGRVKRVLLDDDKVIVNVGEPVMVPVATN